MGCTPHGKVEVKSSGPCRGTGGGGGWRYARWGAEKGRDNCDQTPRKGPGGESGVLSHVLYAAVTFIDCVVVGEGSMNDMRGVLIIGLLTYSPLLLQTN